MMRTTGCDGVIVGRGCLGRPWLFRDLADVFDGREPQDPPALGDVVDIMLEHARLLVAWLGERPPPCAPSASTPAWYTKGFPGPAPAARAADAGARARRARGRCSSPLDRSLPFPPEAMRVPRGKTAARRRWRCPTATSTTSTTTAHRGRKPRPPTREARPALHQIAGRFSFGRTMAAPALQAKASWNSLRFESGPITRNSAGLCGSVLSCMRSRSGRTSRRQVWA